MRATAQVSVADVQHVARKYLDLDHAVVAILCASRRDYPAQWPAAHRAARVYQPYSERVRPYQEHSLTGSACASGRRGRSAGLALVLWHYIIGPRGLAKGAGRYRCERVRGRGLFVTGADYFDRGVQLLADKGLHPALPEGAFKIIQRQLAAAVAGRLQSPAYRVQRALYAALFPIKDPTLRQATPPTVSALTIRGVKEYYQRVFRPDLTIIVVIGQVTSQEAKAVVEKYFGGWKAIGPKPNALLPSVPPNKSTTTTIWVLQCPPLRL